MSQIPIRIVPFDPVHQKGIDQMLDAIATEYEESFFHLPLRKMVDMYQLPDRYYWVALNDETVIGTAGVIITEEYAILKSLFLAKEFRGASYQVAQRLLEVVYERAGRFQRRHLYLGTMAQFMAAQRFYEKQGFTQVDKDALPADFVHNALDTVFYRKAL